MRHVLSTFVGLLALSAAALAQLDPGDPDGGGEIPGGGGDPSPVVSILDADALADVLSSLLVPFVAVGIVLSLAFFAVREGVQTIRAHASGASEVRRDATARGYTREQRDLHRKFLDHERGYRRNLGTRKRSKW